jgi:hypothetical protein
MFHWSHVYQLSQAGVGLGQPDTAHLVLGVEGSCGMASFQKVRSHTKANEASHGALERKK